MSFRTPTTVVLMIGLALPLDALARGRSSGDWRLSLGLLAIFSVAYLVMALRKAFPDLGAILGGLLLMALLSRVIAEGLVLANFFDSEQTPKLFISAFFALWLVPPVLAWLLAKFRSRRE